MMNYITYSPDTAALLVDVEAVSPQHIVTDEDGTKSIGPLTKTPTIRNGGETLAVVKDLPLELQGLTNLVVIGEQYWDANGDPQITLTDQATYDRVYPRTPIVTEEGTYTPPPIFGCVR